MDDSFEADSEEEWEYQFDAEEVIRAQSQRQKVQVMKRLNRGDFGQLDDTAVPTAKLFHDRKLGKRTNLIRQRCLPDTMYNYVDEFYEPLYCGQFSEDGNVFYSACKDLSVRVYDTSGNGDPELLNELSMITPGTWTISDAAINTDEELMVFGSMHEEATLRSYRSENVALSLNFSPNRDKPIYSLDFNESKVVAGLGAGFIRMITPGIDEDDPIDIGAHEGDVNCVKVIDRNLILSGSDDTKVALWDLRDDTKAAGMFLGHTEGVTGLDFANDHYVISNSKDQSAKLWDTRKMLSSQAADRKRNYTTGYDYRWDYYAGPQITKHPDDCSVMTYGGHKVAHTLIRCHFSPSMWGHQYIYSGSSDGSVCIWNVNGELVRHVDTGAMCVRDVSWHPRLPVMYASAAMGLTSAPQFSAWGGGAGALLRLTCGSMI